MPGRTNSEIQLLVDLIDQAYDKRAWHGTNLKGSVRRLTAGEAAWRPGLGRHNIWEIIVHAAYWKYTIRRRLLGEKRGSFPLKGSNWFERPDGGSAATWEQDLKLLEETHHSMREAVAMLSPSLLHKQTAKSKYTNAQVIYGIASHDLYHAGQIQLIKRLMKK